MSKTPQPHHKVKRSIDAFEAWWDGASFIELARKHNISQSMIQVVVYREARRRGLPTHRRLQEMRKAKNKLLESNKRLQQ